MNRSLFHIAFLGKEFTHVHNSAVMQIFCVLIKSTEVEESQQLENATGLFADQEQQLTRSSSTSDITDQFPSDFFQGNFDKIQRYCTSEEKALRLVQPHKCCFYLFWFPPLF